MNILKWIKQKQRQNKRKRALRQVDNQLREFVYLDEVSVYSLIASRLGSIATEFTEIETKSLQEDASGSIDADAGVLKGRGSLGVSRARSNSSHILRKSIIQSQFKELYDIEKKARAICPLGQEGSLPKIENLADIPKLYKDEPDQTWIINEKDLQRGSLIELEVELAAEATFRFRTLFSSLIDMVEEYPNAYGVNTMADLEQVRVINQLLEKLLVGLVPLQGFVKNFSAVEIDQQNWIVHNNLLEFDHDTTKHPLFMVGVADQSLFWKDLRRILFSDASYTMFCRIASDGIKDSWEPIKLIQVIKAVLPNEGENFESIINNALLQLEKNIPKNKGGNIYTQKMKNALSIYSTYLSEQHDLRISDEQKSNVVKIIDGYGEFINTQEERRNAFKEFEDYFIDKFKLDLDAQELAELRENACQEVGLFNFGEQSNNEIKLTNGEEKKDHNRYIDTEPIAIYW